MKKIIFAICLCISSNALAKTYGVVIEACLLGTSCQGSCVDRVSVGFTVDAALKTVTLSGQSVAGGHRFLPGDDHPHQNGQSPLPRGDPSSASPADDGNF